MASLRLKKSMAIPRGLRTVTGGMALVLDSLVPQDNADRDSGQKD